MVSAVETMAYAGDVPWHGLGVPVTDKLTPKQMLKKAGLDWSVSKRKVFMEKDGDMQPIPGQYILARDTDNKPLSIVGETYKPVQNEIALDFFKKFTKAGHMKMETAGSLWGGRYIWALARLSNDFTLGKEDEVRGFLLLSQPHVRGKAMVMQFTPIRVVCWNTLTFALGSNLRGSSNSFRMSHATLFDDSVKRSAEEALGLATDQMDEFKQAAQLLSKKRIKESELESYFNEVLYFDPKKAQRKKDGEVRVPRMLPKFKAALEHAPGATLDTAKGTLWGALNAVTYVVDHENGRERDTALKNAWMGHTANIKRRAMEIALEKAK